MPEFTTAHAPGTFCWVELATTDADAAKKFYTTLFGWTTNEIPMGEMGIYYMFQRNGKDCGAMYQMGPDMQGIPPNWLSYVATSGADAAVEKAKSLGGNVINGPFDVFDSGRMAVIADSQGAAFGVWEAKQHIGVQIRDETNTLCWNELQANLDSAKQFYPALFGWAVKDAPEYSEFHIGGQAVGGAMTSQAPAEVPSHWLPYFSVEDCEKTVAAAQSAGAMLIVPPMDIENVGKFAVLADPQGAVFAVIRLNMRQ